MISARGIGAEVRRRLRFISWPSLTPALPSPSPSSGRIIAVSLSLRHPILGSHHRHLSLDLAPSVSLGVLTSPQLSPCATRAAHSVPRTCEGNCPIRPQGRETTRKAASLITLALLQTAIPQCRRRGIRNSPLIQSSAYLVGWNHLLLDLPRGLKVRAK